MEDLTKNEQQQPVQQDWLELAIHEIETVGVIKEKHLKYMSYVYGQFRLEDRMYDEVRKHNDTIKKMLRNGISCEIIANYYKVHPRIIQEVRADIRRLPKSKQQPDKWLDIIDSTQNTEGDQSYKNKYLKI